MTGKKVLLGFSGGIDSCRAAEILLDRGFDVTALTLDTFGDPVILAQAEKKAGALGIKFRTEDVTASFSRKVIDYFLSEYMSGRTPAPCTVCNIAVKWKTLYDIAAEERFDHIATGHYFTIRRKNDKYCVCKAADAAKDQSYYLWPLTQEILAKTLTPMEDQIKEHIIKELPEDEPRKESMGICFLKNKSCAAFIRDNRGDAIREGEIIDKRGNTIGMHKGTPYYTIGQKKELGLGDGECVVSINPAANRLVVGDDSDLYHKHLVLSDCNITDLGELLSAKDISVKIRGIGRNPGGFCKIDAKDGKLHIELAEPAWAAAPGQPVVLYQGDAVVGGGFLDRYF